MYCDQPTRGDDGAKKAKYSSPAILRLYTRTVREVHSHRRRRGATIGPK